MKIIAPKQLMENQAPVMRNGGVFSRASLDLQFARTRTLDSRITFSRASSGTYVDAAGVIRTAGNNVARFDHNPTTGESLGLLVEESRTNLMPYSVATTTDWSSSGGTNTDLSLNALGVFPGVRCASGGFVYNGLNTGQITSLTNGATYTATFWFRAGDTDPSNMVRFILRNDTTAAPSTIQKNSRTTAFDSTSSYTATDSNVGSSTSSLTVLSVETMADGLTYKLVASFVFEGSSTDLYKFGIHTNSATEGETVIALGMQLEQGSFATSYIATSGSSATRSADVASITGTNFSSWYNQTEGTVFASGITPADRASFPTINSFNDGSADDRIGQYVFTNGFYSTTRANGNQQGDNKAPVTPTDGSVYKLASGFAVNNSVSAANGVIGTVDTTCLMPTGIDRLIIGAGWNNSSYISSAISRLTYWPTRLSDNTLQQIAS